jgi:protein-disulfide isomerase
MTHLNPPVGIEDHAQGPVSASVTLVEYGDYECPYCGMAYPVIKEVQRLMGEHLRFVFRNFPLVRSHPNAGRAAEFAEVAAHLGRFWEAHDTLYEHQDALDEVSLIAYGASLGLVREAVLAAFDGRFDERIRRDFMSGLHSGVNGTPSLFINGLRYDGPIEVEPLFSACRAAAHAHI